MQIPCCNRPTCVHDWCPILWILQGARSPLHFLSLPEVIRAGPMSWGHPR